MLCTLGLFRGLGFRVWGLGFGVWGSPLSPETPRALGVRLKASKSLLRQVVLGFLEFGVVFNSLMDTNRTMSLVEFRVVFNSLMDTNRTMSFLELRVVSNYLVDTNITIQLYEDLG